MHLFPCTFSLFYLTPCHTHTWNGEFHLTKLTGCDIEWFSLYFACEWAFKFCVITSVCPSTFYRFSVHTKTCFNKWDICDGEFKFTKKVYFHISKLIWKFLSIRYFTLTKSGIKSSLWLRKYFWNYIKKRPTTIRILQSPKSLPFPNLPKLFPSNFEIISLESEWRCTLFLIHTPQWLTQLIKQHHKTSQHITPYITSHTASDHMTPTTP